MSWLQQGSSAKVAKDSRLLFVARAVLLGVVFVAPLRLGQPSAAEAATAELAADGGPRLRSPVVLVVHNASGKAKLARRASDVHAIASLTKLQAALVFRAHGLKLDEGTEMTRDDHEVGLGGSRTRLELKWTYRNSDLLHAALLSSDNRAVSALGRAVGLRATALVQAMNELARRMGLRKTTFVGPVGIEHGNVSTAWEFSQIVRAAGKDPVLGRVMRKKEHRVKPLRGYLPVHYHNTNPLVGSKPSVSFTASKTGYNAAAGYSIAVVADVHGVGEHTIVLLGAKHKADRVRDLSVLIQWLRAVRRPARSS